LHELRETLDDTLYRYDVAAALVNTAATDAPDVVDVALADPHTLFAMCLRRGMLRRAAELAAKYGLGADAVSSLERAAVRWC
jgi:hypothetical protein